MDPYVYLYCYLYGLTNKNPCHEKKLFSLYRFIDHSLQLT